jgi:hypothetical protein
MGSPGAWPSQDQGRGPSETIPRLLDRASPLCTAHLRIPIGPQIQFASESFINEIGLTPRLLLHEPKYCIRMLGRPPEPATRAALCLLMSRDLR